MCSAAGGGRRGGRFTELARKLRRDVLIGTSEHRSVRMGREAVLETAEVRSRVRKRDMRGRSWCQGEPVRSKSIDDCDCRLRWPALKGEKDGSTAARGGSGRDGNRQ